MDKIDSCNGVAVISADTRLRAWAVALLSSLKPDLLEFNSIDEFRQSNVRGYSVVLVEDYFSHDELTNLRKLRHFKKLVLISQTKNSDSVVTALYNGADFYFDILESNRLLIARLQAALRSNGEKVRQNIVVPPYNFDVQRRQVFLDNQPIALTPMEYNFAEYLFSRPEVVIANSELMQSVWSLPGLVDTRRVDTAASRVRKKMLLGSHPSGWELQRIRKVGFRLLASTVTPN